MRALSRRDLIRGVIPVAASLAGSARAETKASAKPARMVLGCQRAPTDERALMFFKRHAVDHICGFPTRAEGREGWSADAFPRLRDLCEHHGVALDMIEFPFMASNPTTPG